MKKLFAFLLVVTCSFLSFGQENQAVAQGTETTFSENVAKGVFSFILPEGTSAEEVEKNSAYYTSFFTVEYDATTRKATLKMADNTAESRHVVVRFLISNKVRTVKLGNTEYTVSEFYEKHLK
ncbi:hypothetical protein SAMN05216474_3002 [Lishizhenia tianjinensis]|uniref:Uncharacterized protein n=1 Tax=Lishizhenia tianjinensis TaxID=477690 RepID=A0A1I7BQM3_9FLAO|nr:hypothetical protein [Lishizhenia tianjinensis]SFT89477.1 hypothetical protein SAMN05216474_3002 [Lishizhenia tianjinensis]